MNLDAFLEKIFTLKKTFFPMKKYYLPLMVSSVLISGSNSVLAESYVIKEGTVIIYDETDYQTQSPSNTFTFDRDFDCGTYLLTGGTGDHPATMGSLCVNKAIQNQKKLQKAIKSTAAISSAMSALPDSSPDSKYTCGAGTGMNSGTIAVSAGCASNLTENLTVNTGGSIAFEESQQTGPGTIDNYGIKVGFTYKFGGKKENQLVSLKKKNHLENKVKELSYENDELKARIEKLEKIAIVLTSNENPINVSNLYPNNTDHLIPTRGDL